MSKESRKVPLVDDKGLTEVIEHIPDLEDSHREFLKKRWLHQVLYWDQRSRAARRKYFLLRSVIVVGGVLIPTLAGLQFEALRYVIGGIGLVVALSAALESLFSYGEIWRLKRRAAERLKIEGWRFFQKAGDYSDDYGKAFPTFADRSETIIEQEIEDYVALTRKDQKGESENRTNASNQ